jgi:hypothetical protein
MVGISILGILLLVAMLGGGAAVVVAIALLVAKGRAGAALLIGGFAVLLFVGLIAVAGLFVAYRATAGDVTTVSTQWMPDGTQRWIESPRVSTRTTWNIALMPVIVAGFGVAALLILAARRGSAHSTAAGHRKAWPALLLLPVVGLFLFGSVRTQSYRVSNRNAEMNAIVRQQQAAIAAQQRAVAERAAALGAKAQQHIENVDIQELMDRFDAPRIALQTPLSPATAPAALIAAATASSSSSPPAEAPAVEKSDNATNDDAQSRSLSQPKPTTNPTSSTPADEPPAAEAPAAAATAVSPRPAWVDAPPVRARDLRREVIATEEYESGSECYRVADVYLMLKTYERLQQLIGTPSTVQHLPSITFVNNAMLADGRVIHVADPPSDWRDERLSLLAGMGVTPDGLRNEIITKEAGSNELHEYLESSTRSFGPMKKLYMQIEFTPAFEHNLLGRWDAYHREKRFAYVGVGAASVLGLLGMVWGLLKMDTATKGYYSTRLFLGVPLAIMGAFAIILLCL